MISTKRFREIMSGGDVIHSNSETHLKMHELSQEAIRVTMKINTEYHTPGEIVDLMSELTAEKVDDSFRLFPPFYTDCGKNTRFGKRVFINSGCKFQDQGGITIGDDVLIGHNCVIATINHLQEPDRRGDMIVKPVRIENKVWIGANVTILQGVVIGEGSIVAAGAMVNKDVPRMTVVGGIPAEVIKSLE